MNDLTKGSKDSTWKVRTIKGKLGGKEGCYTLDIDTNTPSEIIYDSNVPVKEQIFNQEDAFAQVLGPNWKQILSEKFNFPNQ